MDRKYKSCLDDKERYCVKKCRKKQASVGPPPRGDNTDIIHLSDLRGSLNAGVHCLGC